MRTNSGENWLDSKIFSRIARASKKPTRKYSSGAVGPTYSWKAGFGTSSSPREGMNSP